MTNPSSKTTTWSYDTDDEVTGVSYSDGVTHSVGYTYTPDGQVATMSDASGTSSYVYDPAGRLISYEDGADATVSYGYDPDGDLTILGYPNGQQVTQSYDDLDRLSSVTDWLGNTTSFGYDADSDLTSTAYPNAISSSLSYDDADELSSITDTKSSSTLVSFSYSRDDDGNITSETDTGTPGAGTTTYSYNSLQQLTGAGSSSYGYDSANDLTSGPEGATQSFDADGELCWSGTGSGTCSSPPAGTTTYTYSSEGDRTDMTPASGPSTSFAWDEANELTGLTTGSSSVSFIYDGSGLRQSETSGSTTTDFTWDTEGSLPLLLADGDNSYIYGPTGTPVEQVSSAGTPSYLLADQLGSTRAITNSTGSVTGSFTYDAWGNVTGSTGSATTPFMYAGQYLDSSTGFYYMRARYYDPTTGQFLSVDPAVSFTQSPFDYAGDDPVTETDPSGACGGARETAAPPPTNIITPKNGDLKIGTEISSPTVYLGGGFYISASTTVTDVKGTDSINEIDLQANGEVDIGTPFGTASIDPRGNLSTNLNGFVGNVQGQQVTVGINSKGQISATITYSKSTTFGEGNDEETVGVDTSVTFTYSPKLASISGDPQLSNEAVEAVGAESVAVNSLGFDTEAGSSADLGFDDVEVSGFDNVATIAVATEAAEAGGVEGAVLAAIDDLLAA